MPIVNPYRGSKVFFFIRLFQKKHACKGRKLSATLRPWQSPFAPASSELLRYGSHLFFLLTPHFIISRPFNIPPHPNQGIPLRSILFMAGVCRGLSLCAPRWSLGTALLSWFLFCPLRYQQKTPPKASCSAGGRPPITLSLLGLSLPCLAPRAVARTQNPLKNSVITSFFWGISLASCRHLNPSGCLTQPSFHFGRFFFNLFILLYSIIL